MVINKKVSLKGKRVLITAGPTWVAIDNMRVISNTASGQNGLLLAERLNRLGAKVTLLLGQVGSCSLNKRIRLVRFSFFEELKSRLQQELKTHRYDAIIQTAAVSDYRPSKILKHKIRSGIKRLRLELRPTPKIINCLKKISPSSMVVGFKFEPQTVRAQIIKKAKDLMRKAGLDLVVANSVVKNRYLAYIVTPVKVYGCFSSKQAMSKALADLIGINLCRN